MWFLYISLYDFWRNNGYLMLDLVIFVYLWLLYNAEWATYKKSKWRNPKVAWFPFKRHLYGQIRKNIGRMTSRRIVFETVVVYGKVHYERPIQSPMWSIQSLYDATEYYWTSMKKLRSPSRIRTSFPVSAAFWRAYLQNCIWQCEIFGFRRRLSFLKIINNCK